MNKSRNNAAQTYGSLDDGGACGRRTARYDIVGGADVIGLGNTIAVITDDDRTDPEGIRVVAVTTGSLNETADQLPILPGEIETDSYDTSGTVTLSTAYASSTVGSSSKNTTKVRSVGVNNWKGEQGAEKQSQNSGREHGGCCLRCCCRGSR